MITTGVKLVKMTSVNQEDIKSKPVDTQTEIKDRVKNVTQNRSRGNKRKEVVYSDAETESSTEN